MAEWISQIGRDGCTTKPLTPANYFRAGRQSNVDVAEHQGDKGKDQHQAHRHEFLGLGQAHGEEDQQDQEDDVGDVALKNDSQLAEDQNGREGGRRDERDLAVGLEEPDQAADKQEYDVNPKYGIRAHKYSGAEFPSIARHIQARIFTAPVEAPECVCLSEMGNFCLSSWEQPGYQRRNSDRPLGFSES
jgi:hypothetical protein